MIEFSLFFFSGYFLLIGLFNQYLTYRWLWSGLFLTLASLTYWAISLKNLVFFNFTYGLNLNHLVLIGLTSAGVVSFFHFQTSVVRDLLAWFSALISLFFASQMFFIDFPSFYTGLTEVFSLGYLGGGAFFYDLRLLMLVISLLVVISIWHRQINQYEYDYAVLLFFGLLSSLLVLTQDSLLLIYLNLEFQALILYVLTSYYRFEESSTEAGLKYLLIGSLVSGFFLIGLLVIYFMNGTYCLSELIKTSYGQYWLFANLLFKLGSVPFYFWTPSVYQQMDYPTLLFVSVVPKISAWFLLIKIFQPLDNSLIYYFGLLSMMVGAIGGLYQFSLGSVVAYSGVLNSGYLLILINTYQTWFTISLYLISYYLVLALIITGLSQHSSLSIYQLSLTFTQSLIFYYFFLSLAGLPVLPGFATKIYLLSLLTNQVDLMLIIFSSLFSVWYYLKIAGQKLFTSSTYFTWSTSYYLALLVFINQLVQTCWSIV